MLTNDEIKIEQADTDINDGDDIKTEESDIFVSEFDVKKETVTDALERENPEEVGRWFFCRSFW